MSKSYGFTFVLWGEQFDEVAATIFVTELREAGLRVKVVGLTPQYIRGSHGLILLPDLTLDQALPMAANAICLVIPYTRYSKPQLNNDPRMQELFHKACLNQAKFVISQANDFDLASLNYCPEVSVDQVLIYPNGDDTVEFARDLARTLQYETVR